MKIKKEMSSLMHIIVDRKVLLKVFSRIRGIVNNKSYIPILSAVLLSTEVDGIEVSVTDLDISFKGFIPAKIISSGSIAVSIEKLIAFMKELTCFEVSIKEESDNFVELFGGQTHSRFLGYSVEEFPILTEPEGIIMIEITSKTLTEMINKTIYSITMEDANLSGVFMETVNKDKEDFLRMVATDGHRLSLIDKKIPQLQEIDIKQGVMIPKKGLIELNKFFIGSKRKRMSKGFGLLGKEGFISLGIKQGNLIVKQGKEFIMIRLLDINFPDYKGILTKERTSNLIIVNRMLLLAAMKRLSLNTTEFYNGIKLTTGTDYLEMVSVNPDLGDVEEKIEIKYDGKPIEIGFNPKYFIDALQTMDSDIIFLDIKDHPSPCLITGEQDEGFLGLIMPVEL